MKISRWKTRSGVRWVADSQSSLPKRVVKTFPSEEKAAQCVAKWREDCRILADQWISLTEAEKVDACKAIRVARLGGFSLLEAAESYKPKLKRSETLGDAVAAFLEAKELTGKRDAYMQTLKNKVELFARGREAMRLDDITPEAIRQFLTPTKYAPATLQGMRRRLSTFFAWCLKHERCTRNPMDKVDGITVPAGTPKIFTVETCERILRAAEVHDRGLIPWLILGLFFGIRPEEIRRLTWEAVKLERGFVEISGEASKVRSRRLVRIPANAKAWLKLGGDLPPVNFWRRIRKLRTKAGVTDWPADVLRHTAASMMLARDRDAASVALDLGNSPEILFRHYRELVSPEDAVRFWGIMPTGVTL